MAAFQLVSAVASGSRKNRATGTNGGEICTPSSLYAGKPTVRLNTTPGYALSGAVMSILVPPNPWSRTTIGRLGSSVPSTVNGGSSLKVIVELLGTLPVG